ncbi:hypothetical protein HFP57_12425 [Parasphingopyxis algicola]|uniref:hypothetical protein n=1 Tax=Parasphingopyxis algicola TaxID=2026624 RepID=UPI0015A3AD99|nr:hypothetical protein [Parasphingopyxis algicola]QLC25740.1 hypothetical protein HFP57_12425 [Parasphingopyxis algicola]
MKRAGTIALVALGSLTLLVTAAFHFTGFAEISAWVDGLADRSFFARAIPTIWLFPSLHWLAIAAGLFAAAWFGIASLRTLLFGCALLLAADAALIYAAVGPFVGSAMLLAAAALYAAAGFGARPAD